MTYSGNCSLRYLRSFFYVISIVFLLLATVSSVYFLDENDFHQARGTSIALLKCLLLSENKHLMFFDTNTPAKIDVWLESPINHSDLDQSITYSRSISNKLNLIIKVPFSIWFLFLFVCFILRLFQTVFQSYRRVVS
jgi:hypothetical protein